MKQYLIKNINARYDGMDNEEKNSGESITIPDMTLTTQEILRRHSLNLPIPEKMALFDPLEGFLPDEFENIEKMNRLELLQMKAENEAKIQATQRKMEKFQRARAQAQRYTNTPEANDKAIAEKLNNNQNIVKNEKE